MITQSMPKSHFFYCSNSVGECKAMGYRQPADLVAQELQGKKLCQSCFNAGYRLTKGVVVTKRKGVS